MVPGSRADACGGRCNGLGPQTFLEAPPSRAVRSISPIRSCRSGAPCGWNGLHHEEGHREEAMATDTKPTASPAPAQGQVPNEVDQYFRALVKLEGSDLHMKVGHPPYVR